jgi:hypothetical protein
MGKWIRCCLLILLTATVAVVADAETTWIAAVAHNTGVGDSTWRSDVAVLNLCDADAVVEMLLHTDGSVFAESFVVPAGEQRIFPDVVTWLTSGNHVGALELRSNVGVTVTSRTYNQTPLGTYGQSIDGITGADGLPGGSVVYLQQLREDSVARTNIGVLNMGGATADLTVTLFDRLGAEVGSFEIEVPAGETVQANRPYQRRFSRTDIVGGFARIEVVSADGVYPYGSVVDNETDDPTTILARPQATCPADIAADLAAIEGLTVTELETEHEGYRYFELHFQQPADHEDPSGEQFQQYVTLLHRSHDAPMVLRTLGYHNTRGDRKAELTGLLSANQLVVEHRFFSSSTPASGNLDLLNIRQAAADHHRIVQALRPIYTGAWINTGHSKGGMTAFFHRRFYPDDVDATVSYVAPLTYGRLDERYLDFVANVGTAECNQALWDFQREALVRRDGLIDILEASTDWTYDWMGGTERAFETMVLEVPFAFWQYHGERFCSEIPSTAATDQAIFDFIEEYVGWIYLSDAALDYYSAYYYQAHTELGYPEVATAHLDDLLVTDPPSPEAGALRPGTTAVFDHDVIPDIQEWIATEGSQMMFIYGEYDPWTGGMVELGDATDSYLFVDPGGTHGSYIRTLEPEDQETALAVLQRWTGVTPVMPTTAKEAPERYPPWRRFLPGFVP